MAHQSTSQCVTEAEQQRSRHMSTALHYANAIQNQKDWEKQILSTIETLLDFPSVDPLTPHPILAQQAQYLAASLSPFRPTDLDDLIEERRIESRCGWPLCSNPPKASGNLPNSPWKASKRDQEFCSLECAKKTIFVKVQLSKVPPWERSPGQQVTISLPANEQKLVDSISPSQGEGNDGNEQRQIATPVELAELALERGENTTSLRPQQVMTDQIVEKTPKFKKPVFESLGFGNEGKGGGGVEGYVPKPIPMSKGKAGTIKSINVSDDEDEYDDNDEVGGDLNDLAKEVFQQLKGKG